MVTVTGRGPHPIYTWQFFVTFLGWWVHVTLSKAKAKWPSTFGDQVGSRIESPGIYKHSTYNTVDYNCIRIIRSHESIGSCHYPRRHGAMWHFRPMFHATANHHGLGALLLWWKSIHDKPRTVTLHGQMVIWLVVEVSTPLKKYAPVKMASKNFPKVSGWKFQKSLSCHRSWLRLRNKSYIHNFH